MSSAEGEWRGVPGAAGLEGLRGAEAVLVLRLAGGGGRALYAFVAAGCGALAHLAVPGRESAEGLLRMCRSVQASLPGWRRLRSFLVEPRLCGRLEPALSEAFPGTETRPSPLLRVRRSALRPDAQRLLLSALSAAAPRPENLRALRTLLSAFLRGRPPEEALLEPRLWDWGPLPSRSWRQRCLQLERLERLALSLGRAFRQGPSLHSCLAAAAQACQSLCRDPQPSPRQAPSPPPLEREAPAQEEALQGFQRALRELCSEPGALLCLGELRVLQRSERLVGVEEEAVRVQILEPEQALTLRGSHSCSCPFARDFRLPCRHLLAVLNAKGKEVDPNRIPARWRRAHGGSRAVTCDTDALLEVLSGSWDDSGQALGRLASDQADRPPPESLQPGRVRPQVLHPSGAGRQLDRALRAGEAVTGPGLATLDDIETLTRSGTGPAGLLLPPPRPAAVLA